MEKELYVHNRVAYDNVMDHYAEGNKKACVVHATGTGKSYIIGAVSKHFEKVIVVAPNRYVLDETRKTVGDNATFVTYALLCRRDKFKTYDLVVLDEFHRAGATRWQKGVERLLACNPNAHIFGTSATQIRYLDDARDMSDELFDGQVVSSLSLSEAIRGNILAMPKLVQGLYSFDPTKAAVSARISSMHVGEQAKMELRQMLSKVVRSWSESYGASQIIAKHISKDVSRIIVFCPRGKGVNYYTNILQSWFAKAGFKNVLFYNISSHNATHNKEMAEFRTDEDGVVKVAVSVDMLNEGVHVRGVDAVILLRSTISRIIVEQQIGRCLTADSSALQPVILDLVNNVHSLAYKWEYKSRELNSTHLAAGCKESVPFEIFSEVGSLLSELKFIDSRIEQMESITKEECIEKAKECRTMKDFARLYPIHYNTSVSKGWIREMYKPRKSVAKYTPEMVEAVIEQYETLTQFSKDHPGMEQYARKNKLPAFMNLKRRGITLTKDECKALALQYKDFYTFSKEHRGVSEYIRRKGWSDECCGHLSKQNKGFSYEQCKEIASRCHSYKEFLKTSSGAMQTAHKNGWYKEITAHFIRPRRWTFEDIIPLVKECKTRNEFFHKHGGAYNWLSKKKRLEEMYRIVGL